MTQRPPCLNCAAPSEHDHHVVPRSVGGVATVPLCGHCHALAHGHHGLRTISDLTRATLAHLKAAGVKLGGEALGWARSESRDDEGRRIVEAEVSEVAAVTRVFALKAEGLSLRAIAAQLEAEGFATKRGGRWQAETVRKVLARGAA